MLAAKQVPDREAEAEHLKAGAENRGHITEPIGFIAHGGHAQPTQSVYAV